MDFVPAHAPPKRLIRQLREALQLRQYSPRTEEAYVAWVRRYVRFHGLRHPAELGPDDVTRFLSSLATERQVGASTQNQALAAVLFLYREVLGQDVGWLGGIVHAKRSARLPVVLSRAEERAVLQRMSGPPHLVALLLYGSGLRLLEALELRVKDIDLERGEIRVRAGKGDRDRVTMLPTVVRRPLEQHLVRVKRLHQADRANGAGWVELPHALRRKLPYAGIHWSWQWVFPAT